MTDLVTKPLILADELEEERKQRAPLCVSETLDLHPDGVILCGDSTFDLLMHSGLPVLHAIPVPFPSGRGREAFRAAMSEILPAFGWRAPIMGVDQI